MRTTSTATTTGDHPAPSVPTTTKGPTVRLDSVQQLLTAIEALPPSAGRVARRRVADALQRPAPAARAALGLLALDLAVVEHGDGSPADEVLVVPELLPAHATA